MMTKKNQNNKAKLRTLSMGAISLVLVALTSCNQQSTLSKSTYIQKEETEYINLDIQITTFNSTNSDVKKELDKFNTLRTNELKEYADTLRFEATECFEDLNVNEYEKPAWKYSYNVTDTLMNFTAGDMISVLEAESIFTGGAHPNTFYKAYNYDLKKHKLLNKKDLFNTTDPKELNAILYKIFKEQDTLDIELFNKPTLKSTDAICVTKDQIIFVYNCYTLACHAAGPIKIKVDKKLIIKYLK